jgi:hypothetical protein
MSAPLDALPPLRFFDGDDQERARLDRPASAEGAAQ